MSQKIANLVLFPRILQSKETVLVASNGTSCRHQLKDGIEKKAYHTAEILYDALSEKSFKL
jgi:hypothetical protein